MSTMTSEARLSRRSGFTLAELLIYVVISALMGTVIVRFMLNQSRNYATQVQVIDARETVRGAVALLTWEFRGLSAEAGDIYAMDSASVAIRSVLATGIVCGQEATALPRYGIFGRTGQIFTTANDSALVYLPGLKEWRELGLVNAYTPASGGVPNCTWGDSTATPGVVVEMSGDTTGVINGTAWRAFRKIQYGLYQDTGRWWIGRKVGGAANYEKLTGPVRAGDGFGLVYRDENGNVTANPAQVSSVELIIRSESAGTDMWGTRSDSVRTRVTLRG